MELAERLAAFLQAAGGWGLAAILMVVIWRMRVNENEKNERIYNLLNKQNEMLDVLKEIRMKQIGGG